MSDKALDVTRELGQNFIEYAAAVNTDRSIPDAKSGLKPVARRILWGAFDGGRTSNKPYVKNARIVGEVMGAWHPHGDSSIYGALVRLSQPWIMRYPLIDFHGNQGSINGDGAAAMRYTEGRLNTLSEKGMLAGIKKKNVDFVPNYSDDAEEPITLPAIFPNLLCNPNSGIGVALSCSWGCHNLREVETAIFDYLDGKEPMIAGPDFPTGGVVINKDVFPAIMRTGRGSVKIRAKYSIEKNKIIITEIPYGTTVEGLLAEIGKYCDENENAGVSKILDLTSNKGVRIEIDCEKERDPESVIKVLFAKTKLQTSFSYNQVGLVNKTPVEMNLTDCCKVYVEHNKECIKRECQFDLDAAKARLHIVEGLLIALEDIDNVIQIIKKSESSAAAKKNLIEKYSLSEIQAKAILDIKLSRLAKLERLELENEKKELVEKISDLEDILAKDSRQTALLKERLSEIVSLYGDDRRTALIQIEENLTDKNVKKNAEPCYIALCEDNEARKYFKEPTAAQRRTIKEVILTDTSDALLSFTSTGKVYMTNLDKLPSYSTAEKPSLRKFLNLPSTEKILLTLVKSSVREDSFLEFFTKKGYLKKISIKEFLNIKRMASKGNIATKLRKEDSLVNVSLAKEKCLLVTSTGEYLLFDSSLVNPSGKTTLGTKGIYIIENQSLLKGFSVNSNQILYGTFNDGSEEKILIKSLLESGSKGGLGEVLFKDIKGKTIKKLEIR